MNIPNPNMSILVETEYCIECVDASIPKIESCLENIPTMVDGQNADIQAKASILRHYALAYRSFPRFWKNRVTYDIWFRVTTCHQTQNDMIAHALSSTNPYCVNSVPAYINDGHNEAFSSIKRHIESVIPNILRVSRCYVRHKVVATQGELRKYHDAIMQHAQVEMNKLDLRYKERHDKKNQYEQDIATCEHKLQLMSSIDATNEEMEEILKEYKDFKGKSSRIRLLDMDISGILKAGA